MIDTTQSSQSPFSTPNSSQDSLHKNQQQQQQQQKKKGIKSSLGRLFSKKEKQKAKGLPQDMLLPSGEWHWCLCVKFIQGFTWFSGICSPQKNLELQLFKCWYIIIILYNPYRQKITHSCRVHIFHAYIHMNQDQQDN